MAFSFHIRSEPATRDLIIRLCEQYNPGRTSIRKEFNRTREGWVIYTVDVCEVTAYGHELHDWLQRGKWYDQERKKNPDFPELYGPVWTMLDAEGNMDSRYTPWDLKLASPRPRHC